MSSPPYPLIPEPMRKSWLEQHPHWKIPLGCLTLIFLIVLFIVVVFTIVAASLRASDVYKLALATAAGNSQVQAEIGQPIRPAWFVSGTLHVSGSIGDANVSIPISGPRGKGVVRAIAAKSRGVWRFTLLQVSFEGRQDLVDLLSVQPPAEREF